MFNIGDFKKYIRDGRRREDMIGVPRRAASDETVADEDRQKMAKTFLSVTLSEHDKKYHKGGYKEGDSCNFREALKCGDSADALVAAEKKEADIKVGFVRFKENEKTGRKEIVGIEEVKKVNVDGDDGEPVKVAGLREGEMKEGVAEDAGETSNAGAIRRYLEAVGK